MADDAEDAVKAAVEDQLEPGTSAEENLYALGVMLLLGASVSAVSYQLWNHYSYGTGVGPNHYMGIWILLASGGGLAALLFARVYKECGSVSEALSTMMKLSPVVYGIIFLAALIPGIEIYLHPNHDRS